MYDAENVRFKFNRLRRHLKSFDQPLFCLGLFIAVELFGVFKVFFKVQSGLESQCPKCV